MVAYQIKFEFKNNSMQKNVLKKFNKNASASNFWKIVNYQIGTNAEEGLYTNIRSIISAMRANSQQEAVELHF